MLAKYEIPISDANGFSLPKNRSKISSGFPANHIRPEIHFNKTAEEKKKLLPFEKNPSFNFSSPYFSKNVRLIT
jgi:hypothetical protein